MKCINSLMIATAVLVLSAKAFATTGNDIVSGAIVTSLGGPSGTTVGAQTTTEGVPRIPRAMVLRVAAPDAAGFLAGDPATPVLKDAFAMIRGELSGSGASEVSDLDLARKIVLEVTEME